MLGTVLKVWGVLYGALRTQPAALFIATKVQIKIPITFSYVIVLQQQHQFIW